ncbi:tRNA-uridine aminocarboxypropyltransferase 2 isoform X3 [Zalophus californianus]|uniref:tRNA-uridine aminocarboxypropyltransferase n=1 Tax=Zalophus californianus TaxID=9704 RepID=A0A6J2E0U7_ZALCA|nr:tRNA-uridine aminocarboxypropyltransferase 2 isoform X3 [Zalophus californianus]
MEPQKEARTPGDPVARSSGPSRSQTPNDEERQEGDTAPAEASLGAEADGACADALWELPVEPAERRPECSRCSRPQKVCLCPFLPLHPLHISTHLYIIQHPAEENKVLRTVPLLTACLPQDKCKVKIGRRFSEERDPELSTVCRKSDTLILYPGAEAANLEEFILDSPIYPSTIIIIDGTWSQAKDIFYKNSLFRLPKQEAPVREGPEPWKEFSLLSWVCLRFHQKRHLQKNRLSWTHIKVRNFCASKVTMKRE